MTGGALSLVFAAVAFYVAAQLERRRHRRQQRDHDRLEASRQRRRHQPPSLHPLIDPDRCIGSLSCVRACPEGDIIGLVDGRATLVEAAACIGHGRCAVECPTGAIQLVLGTPDRKLQLPRSDAKFESTRAGLHVIGEVAGMGLIARALQQGLALAPHLKAAVKELKATDSTSPDDRELADVVIVGGGPAGIACGIGCLELGLKPVVLEQESLGGCVAHYPRGKVVMTETVTLPFVGSFGREVLSKEELLEELERVLDAAKLKIDEGKKVVGVDGHKGAFEVRLAEGQPVRGRLVVLAIGLRGSPRKLGVPGEDLAKVSYRLIEPEQFDGARVLVVGGGDSAAEAAIQLALESTARVTLSYRGRELNRCKPILAERLGSLFATGRVRGLLETQVASIHRRQVKIKTSSGKVGRLKNDHVIVLAGGELPTTFLDSCGVELAEHAGSGQTPSSAPSRARHIEEVAPAQAWTTGERALAAALAVLTLVAIGGLVALGWDYYQLPLVERPSLTAHADLRPTGPWGHTMGVSAAVLMALAFLYVLRKRGSPLGGFASKGKRSIRNWMIVHAWAGTLGPALVVFHAAVAAQSWMAVWSAVGFGLVVGTGLFGLVCYPRMPADLRFAEAGMVVGGGRVQRRLRKLEHALDRALLGPPAEVAEAIRRACRPEPSTTMTHAWARMPAARAHLREAFAQGRPHFLAQADADRAEKLAERVLNARLRAAGFDEIKRWAQPWLALHIASAVVITLVTIGHIALSLYLGFDAAFGAVP